MARTITNITAHDVRFPTSRQLDGSDAMNDAPDYSAAYALIETDAGDGLVGHGFAFTIGRGNEICVQAIESLAPIVIGRTLEEITADPGKFWRLLAGDSQLRWIGPEKGAIHLATAAVVNAVWDLWAKVAGKPLWKLLADMTPAEIVRAIDFRHVTDALTPDEARAILEHNAAGKAEREREMREHGFPAYTTSAGWLGYSDEKLRHLCRTAVKDGWMHFKQKVGGDIEDDLRRARLLREEIGEQRHLMMDANQVWEVDQAIANMRRLAAFKPWWIEEPLSPDDILGHARVAEALRPLGIKVATGEHCHNRVMFKQFLQAHALDFCQLDTARLGGVNEVLAVLLMARKFGVPVCPHAGGVGLCELEQHVSIFDYIAVSASLENRILEYVDHLHEHFVDPVEIRDGHYMPPSRPGFSAALKPASLAEYSYPAGSAWHRKQESRLGV
ncbi:MAG: L-fuconate dehydratase [Acetobacteraceae bacterium]